MKLIKDLLSIFFPDLCINCYSRLLEKENHLCTICLNDLPVIVFNDVIKKMLKSIFYGKIPIEDIYSFMYFTKNGITQKLIHGLKYKNQENIGEFIGRRICYEITKLQIFKNIDVIVPVPLHKSKLKKRGYNQVDYLGNILSVHLNIPFMSGVLERESKSKTQTRKQRFERFSNSGRKFFIPNIEYLENKHILLLDDVITTGGTLISCSEELLKVKNIKISICTIAYTEKG